MTKISKQQRSPAKNTSTAKLRIVDNDDRIKRFEFDSREELIQVDQKLTELRREIHVEKKRTSPTSLPSTPPRRKSGVGEPVSKQPKNQQQDEPIDVAASSNGEETIKAGNQNTKKKKMNRYLKGDDPKGKPNQPSDATRSDPEKFNKTKDKSTKKKQQQQPMTEATTAKKEQPKQQGQLVVDPDLEKAEIVAAASSATKDPQEEEQQQSSPYSVCVTMVRLYIRVWSYTLMCIILAIAGTIGSVNFRKGCSVMLIQLQNTKTGEPIEETQRGYGLEAREIEPGEIPDSPNSMCREYTPVEQEETFSDQGFVMGEEASQRAIVYGSILCGLVLVGPTLIYCLPYTTTIQKYTIRWILVFFCFSAIVSQALSFQVFQTQFCQNHICKKGPGVGPALFAILMWILLLLVLLVGPGFIPL